MFAVAGAQLGSVVSEEPEATAGRASEGLGVSSSSARTLRHHWRPCVPAQFRCDSGLGQSARALRTAGPEPWWRGGGGGGADRSREGPTGSPAVPGSFACYPGASLLEFGRRPGRCGRRRVGSKMGMKMDSVPSTGGHCTQPAVHPAAWWGRTTSGGLGQGQLGAGGWRCGWHAASS